MEDRLDPIIQRYHYQKLHRLGATILHYAARCGETGFVDYLLREGEHDVNAKDCRGRTPLMMAVKGKDETIVKTLLAAGANILDVDHKGRSALSMLCADYRTSVSLNETILKEFRKQCSDSQDCAKKLINAGCHLFQAAYIEDVKIIEYMLKQGFSSNSMHPLIKLTALHTAVGTDDLESFKLLLKYGADAHAVDIMNCNSLQHLYRYSDKNKLGKNEILKILLDLGVSATSCTDEGGFQIRSVLEYGDKAAVRLILQSNIDFTLKDLDGNTLLHYIANNPNPGIVEELKLHINKFNVNEVDKDGLTPIHSAAFYGNVEMMTFLLEQGAHTNGTISPHGYTPLYYACTESTPENKTHYDQCIELLLQNDADPQFLCTEENGETVTVFDVPEIETTKSVVAQIAVLQELGKPITTMTRSKIKSHNTHRKYFRKYRRILKTNISGSVTILKLFMSNERKMAQYLNNKDLVLKLKRLSYKQKVKLACPYYYNTLEKSFIKGMKYRTLKDKAVEVITKISENLGKTNIVVDRIIDYLSNENLKQLCEV